MGELWAGKTTRKFNRENGNTKPSLKYQSSILLHQGIFTIAYIHTFEM